MLKHNKNIRPEFNNKYDSISIKISSIFKMLLTYRNYLLGCVVSLILILFIFSFLHHKSVAKEIIAFEKLVSLEKEHHSLANDYDHETVYNKTKDQYMQIIDEFSNSNISEIAKITLARIGYTIGVFEDSIILYSEVLQKLNETNPILKNIILIKLAHCYISNDCLDKGKICFEQVLESDRLIMKDEALFNIALLYESDNNFISAKKMYKQFLVDFPDSLYARIVKQKLNDLNDHNLEKLREGDVSYKS